VGAFPPKADPPLAGVYYALLACYLMASLSNLPAVNLGFLEAAI